MQAVYGKALDEITQSYNEVISTACRNDGTDDDVTAAKARFSDPTVLVFDASGAGDWTEENPYGVILQFGGQTAIKLANFLKENGIRTHVLKKISEDAEEIPSALRQGHIAYVINTRDMNSQGQASDGYEIRKLSIENNITMFTALDTVHVLLDVLEETTLCVSTIDA